MSYFYLVINKPWPESSQGSIIGLFWQDGMVPPSLINVFKDHKRLSQRSSVVDKHRHLLVNRVVFEKKITLVSEIFVDVGVMNSLQFEGYLDPSSIRASPHTKQLNFSIVLGHCRVTTFTSMQLWMWQERATPLKKVETVR